MGIIVYPFAGTLDPEFILLVDNDQLRMDRRVIGFFGHELVKHMDLLARHSDMKCIKHVWDCLQRRIAASNVQYGTRESLERKVVDDQDMIPLADIRKFI